MTLSVRSLGVRLGVGGGKKKDNQFAYIEIIFGVFREEKRKEKNKREEEEEMNYWINEDLTLQVD